ncbi:MAG: diguanylate cyclase [Frankiales bacterium]|nr:diguanylate cyclase [Frankiales bacterium]
MSSWPQEEPALSTRDQVAEHRDRRAPAGHLTQVPQQRLPTLDEPDREQYERQLDDYQVQVESYRAQLADYAERLDAARHDGLTGTWLRAAGDKLLEQAVHRVGLTGSRLSVAFVDVDGLKLLNDGKGHAAGDQALRAVGSALLRGLRQDDVVIRWGGDEFLCVLPGATEQDARHRLAEAQRLLAEHPEHRTVSVGTAQWRPGESRHDLIGRADRALYRSRGRHVDP